MKSKGKTQEGLESGTESRGSSREYASSSYLLLLASIFDRVLTGLVLMTSTLRPCCFSLASHSADDRPSPLAKAKQSIHLDLESTTLHLQENISSTRLEWSGNVD